MIRPTKLGNVVNVTGAAVTVELSPDTISGLVFVDGQAHRIGQVGGFVRIPQGYGSLYGIVAQAGVAAAPTPELANEPHGRRWLVAELVGEGVPNQAFSRGVSQNPTIGDAVHLVTEDDLRFIYGREASKDYVEIGHLANARSVPAFVEVNRVVTPHSAIVGFEGSGESKTVAGLLTGLSDPRRFPSSRILVLDLHGEYASAFPDRANVYRVAPNRSKGELAFHVPFWALTFDELLQVTFGELDEQGNCRGYVQDEITRRKRKANGGLGKLGVNDDQVNADSPIPFSLHQLWYDLHTAIHATYAKGVEQNESTRAVIDVGDPERVLPPRFQPNDGQKFVAAKLNLPMSRQVEAMATPAPESRAPLLVQPRHVGPKHPL